MAEKEIKENTIEEFIKIRVHSGIKKIWAKDIMYCKADGCYTIIHDKFGNETTESKPIEKIEAKLSSYGVFFRIHKSYLVNTCYITEFKNSNNHMIVLNNNIALPVAFRRVHLLYKIFK